MRRIFASLALILIVSIPVGAKEIKIRGYVTNIVSPTEFEIEDYRITHDVSLVLDFDKDEDSGNLDFNPGDLRVGTLLEIKGDYDEKSGVLRAKSIKVLLEEFKKVKRTALIERRPEIVKAEKGWTGTFFADGQRIRVDESTQVYFKPNASEKALLKQKSKAKAKDASKPSADEALEESEGTLLQSLDLVGPNTFLTYQGVRQADGAILAARVELMRNEMEKGEANMWKGLKVKVKPANFIAGKEGELNITKVGKFKLVPSDEAQAYLRALGEKLIPPQQKMLAQGDPNKIPFQFFLVQTKSVNAFATPNGIVVVFSELLDNLENEAQLATVVGHEISHAVQEHTWRQQQYHRKKLMALKIGAAVGSIWGGRSVMDIADMIEGAVKNGYQRTLENQSDRAGLEYMLAAGYDIREAPRVWKLMALRYGDHATNFFWSDHDNHSTRRSYLMAELRTNYSDVKYDTLVTNSEQFQKIKELVRTARAKQRIKVKH